MSDVDALRAELSVDSYRNSHDLSVSLKWGPNRLYPALRELRQAGELVDFWDDRYQVGYYRLRGEVPA